MQTIPFTKMHGCGNDYVYIDQFDTPFIRDPAALAVRLSERHRGIAASENSCLITDTPPHPSCALRLRQGCAWSDCGSMTGSVTARPWIWAWRPTRVRKFR